MILIPYQPQEVSHLAPAEALQGVISTLGPLPWFSPTPHLHPVLHPRPQLGLQAPCAESHSKKQSKSDGKSPAVHTRVQHTCPQRFLFPFTMQLGATLAAAALPADERTMSSGFRSLPAFVLLSYGGQVSTQSQSHSVRVTHTKQEAGC